MNPIQQLASKALNDLLGHVSAQAGAAVANSPAVQGALAQAQGEIDWYKTVGNVAGVLAILTFVFYFLPRFESPIPRIYRGRK